MTRDPSFVRGFSNVNLILKFHWIGQGRGWFGGARKRSQPSPQEVGQINVHQFRERAGEQG